MLRTSVSRGSTAEYIVEYRYGFSRGEHLNSGVSVLNIPRDSSTAISVLQALRFSDFNAEYTLEQLYGYIGAASSGIQGFQC